MEALTRAVHPNRHARNEAGLGSISVIISTYNNPKWLEKSLWGFFAQRFDVVPFELIVADDGSTDETRSLINHYRKESPVPLKHVWHRDDGFRKCRILNKAIASSTSDYLVFTDQDCVPRGDFLAAHFRHAERGSYLSGGYLKLPMALSTSLTREQIVDGRAFNADWLKREHGLSTWKILPKLVDNPRWAAVLNWLTTTSATCNGCCFSAWRDDLVAVNGYNEQMRYGGLDRELGERLMHYGIRAKQLRHTLVCVHLDHERPYATPKSWERNRAIRHDIRKNKQYRTADGLDSGDDEENREHVIPVPHFLRRRVG